jgi:DNA-binding NtrC family response regulator
MPAQIVIVHDQPDFAEEMAAALRLAGHEVAAFHDPMIALDALDAARKIEVLISRIGFAEGKPNGLALARMARAKRPGIRVVFTANPEFEAHAAGLGTFLASPVNVADVVAAVERFFAPAPYEIVEAQLSDVAASDHD